MDKTDKDIQFGNEGRDLIPGKTENLSSITNETGDAHDLDASLRPREKKGNPDIVDDMRK